MRFLADENFNRRILRGIWRENPDVDITRIQDTEVFQADDPTILAYAAEHGLILLTHDLKTMPRFAYDRVEAEQPMPGVIAIAKKAPIGVTIADLLLVLVAMPLYEIDQQVIYLPIK